MNLTFKKSETTNDNGSKQTDIEINTDVLKHIKEDVSKVAGSTAEIADEVVKKVEEPINRVMFIVHRVISVSVNLAYLIYGLILLVELTPVYFGIIENALKNNDTFRAIEVGLIYCMLVSILMIMILFHRWYKRKFLPNSRWF